MHMQTTGGYYVTSSRQTNEDDCLFAPDFRLIESIARRSLNAILKLVDGR